jgi:hypothetical protein
VHRVNAYQCIVVMMMLWCMNIICGFLQECEQGAWRVRENLGVEVDTTEGENEFSSVHVHDDDHHRDEECRRDHIFPKVE